MRFLALLLGAGVAAAAPVPRQPPTDPLGRGYMGFYPVEGTLVVRQVEANTPAARAGLRAGDAITAIGDCTPASFDDLVQYVANLRPGSVVRLVTRRGVESRACDLTLGNRPADAGLLPRGARFLDEEDMKKP